MPPRSFLIIWLFFPILLHALVFEKHDQQIANKTILNHIERKHPAVTPRSYNVARNGSIHVWIDGHEQPLMAQAERVTLPISCGEQEPIIIPLPHQPETMQVVEHGEQLATLINQTVQGDMPTWD